MTGGQWRSLTSLVTHFLWSLNPLWKSAVQYSDLVLRFSISLVVIFYAGQWVEREMGWSWVAVSSLAILGPVFFWRMLKGLERLQQVDE